MKIGSFGLRQSGSTMLFNLLRFLCEKKGKTIGIWHSPTGNAPTTNTYYKNKTEYDYIIIKSHGCTSDGEKDHVFDKIITSIRDPRDSASSALKRYNEQPLKNVEANWYNYNSIKNKTDYFFFYEKYKKDKLSIVKELCKVIGLAISEDDMTASISQTERLFEDTSLPGHNDMSHVTLLSQSHNTSNGRVGHYRDKLNKHVIEEIEEKYGDWIRELGYIR